MGEKKSLLQGLMGYDSSRRLLLLTDNICIILISKVSYCLPIWLTTRNYWFKVRVFFHLNIV